MFWVGKNITCSWVSITSNMYEQLNILVQEWNKKLLDDNCLDLGNKINVIDSQSKKFLGILKYECSHRDNSQSIVLML